MSWSWERVIHGVATAALAGFLGEQVVSNRSAVPATQCAAVIENLANVQAQTRAEADRCTCKYRHAKGEAGACGADLPRTRAEWDAICSPSDEAATLEPRLLAEAR